MCLICFKLNESIWISLYCISLSGTHPITSVLVETHQQNWIGTQVNGGTFNSSTLGLYWPLLILV